jgi:tRNA(Ile2) C34 agmatinyltransferase TiaS
MPYCPECGGEMLYLSGTKHYVCRRCGLSLTLQEIVEFREKIRDKTERDDEEQKRIRKEYLRWWLSRKK